MITPRSIDHGLFKDQPQNKDQDQDQDQYKDLIAEAGVKSWQLVDQEPIVFNLPCPHCPASLSQFLVLVFDLDFWTHFHFICQGGNLIDSQVTTTSQLMASYQNDYFSIIIWPVFRKVTEQLLYFFDPTFPFYVLATPNSPFSTISFGGFQDQYGQRYQYDHPSFKLS